MAETRVRVEPNYGVLEDGFGGIWRKCRHDCRMEIVRPGKVQCDECDYRCGMCGGKVTYHRPPTDLKPGQGSVSGYWCDACGPFGENAPDAEPGEANG